MTLMKRKRVGLGDAMSVVTRFVNACNRHDADAVYACLHPEFDSIQPMFPTRNFRGADQVRRNWQAIFDAEPGFRLTVLRSAAAEDTVWLELHGAGRDAEVAGVFVMGITGDRIRWARIYSALVEPVPTAADDATPPSSLREVPPLDEPVAAGNGEVVEEALIAPVVDIERPSRRGRRSARRHEVEAEAEAEAEVEVEAEAEAVAEAVAETDAEAASVEAEPAPVPEDAVRAPAEVAEPAPVPEEAAEPAPEPSAESDAEVEAEEEVVVVVTEEAPAPEPEPQVLVEPAAEAEAEAPAEATVARDILSEFEQEDQPEAAAEAEPMKPLEPDTQPAAEPAAEAPPPDDQPKRWFKRR